MTNDDGIRIVEAHPRTCEKQQGAALLIVFLLMALGILSLLVTAASFNSAKIARDQVTTAALAKAKEALLAYAVTYGDLNTNNVPGYLPCPDTGNGIEGQANCPTSNPQDVTLIGRLPWKKLGIEPPHDGSGDCLWYIVSGTFKNTPPTALMNWDTLGQIEVIGPDDGTVLAGVTADARAAAVIIAPGQAMAGQNRLLSAGAAECGGNYTATNYLDSYMTTTVATTATGTIAAGTTINNALVETVAGTPKITRLIAAPTKPGGPFTDMVLVVTPTDIFNAVTQRRDFVTSIKKLTSEMALCVSAFGRTNSSSADLRLPVAAPVSLTNYGVNANYLDNTGPFLAGRFPYRVQYSKNQTGNPNYPASSSYALLRNAVSGCPWGTWETNWYNNWKDQFFYAVAKDFAANAPVAPPTTCGTCLTVDSLSTPYAAVVMFAGRKQGSQTRATAASKGTIGNYLDGANSTSYPNSGGNSNYQTPASLPVINDILYCIQPGMTASDVLPCP